MGEIDGIKKEVSEFIQRINELPQNSRIALKRNCGKTLRNADISAMMAFYRALGKMDGFKKKKEGVLFSVACMECLWEKEELQKEAITFEAAMGAWGNRAQKEENIEKRLIELLNLKWDADGILCQSIWRIVKQLKREGYQIDMVSLGVDFCYWNSSEKVKQRWAETYYKNQKEEEKNVD